MALSPFAISFSPTAFVDPVLVLAGSLALCMTVFARPLSAGLWLGAAIMTKQQGLLYVPLVVAMLAGLSPLGTVASAIFIASVFVGADSMSRALGVSSYLADLIVAMALLCVLVASFLARYRIRRIVRHEPQAAPEASVGNP